jgi:hypothetical protein
MIEKDIGAGNIQNEGRSKKQSDGTIGRQELYAHDDRATNIMEKMTEPKRYFKVR